MILKVADENIDHVSVSGLRTFRGGTARVAQTGTSALEYLSSLSKLEGGSHTYSATVVDHRSPYYALRGGGIRHVERVFVPQPREVQVLCFSPFLCAHPKTFSPLLSALLSSPVLTGGGV